MDKNQSTKEGKTQMTPRLKNDLEIIYVKRRFEYLTSLHELRKERAHCDDFRDLDLFYPDVNRIEKFHDRLTEIHGADFQLKKPSPMEYC